MRLVTFLTPAIYFQANVVCRQLGFIKAKGITKESKFGIVPPEFAFDRVDCSGPEAELGDCRSTSGSVCTESTEGAGIVCDKGNT